METTNKEWFLTTKMDSQLQFSSVRISSVQEDLPITSVKYPPMHYHLP